jgi:hypothetical protein
MEKMNVQKMSSNVTMLMEFLGEANQVGEQV